MRDMGLYRHLLGVSVALFLALSFVSLAQAAPGDLDPSFGIGGKVTTDFGISDDFANAHALAIQADGKIVVAGTSEKSGGTDFALARFNAEGSLDTTFGTSGTATTSIGISGSTANVLALQADGKIVVAGSSSDDFALARYNTDGSLDTSFGTGGMVTTNFGGSDEANALAIQADGKIVVAGSSDNSVNQDFGLVRYNPDGSLDITFGIDGKVITDFSGGDDEANALAIQADGKIVVAGSASYVFALSRYNADGTLDTTFGNGGTVITDIDSMYTDYAVDLSIQTDGKIVVVGGGSGSHSRLTLVRYNTDGTLDTTFGVDFTSGPDYPQALAIQSDGKIVVAASYYLVRFNADGSLDISFGTGGKVYGGGSDMVIQSDGKIVVAVGSFLVRYNLDGSLDATFGDGGKVSTDPGNSIARALAIQSDGKIVVAGGAYGTNYLARYNPDGSLDITFGIDGKVITDFSGGDDEANALALQSDGKIVVAGPSWNGTNTDFALARYNTDGSLDTSFGTGGMVTTNFGGSDEANALAIQADGKIVVAGYASNGINYDFALARYNTNGALDTDFGIDGTVTTDLSGGDIYNFGDQANALALQADGKIVVAGVSWYCAVPSKNGSCKDVNDDFALARYNADGSLDTTFGRRGKVTTDFGNSDDGANTLAIQVDGKIVVAGYAQTNTDYTTDFALARYNTNGSLDTSFGRRGKVTTDFNSGGNWWWANALTIQADGKIVVAGTSEKSGGTDFALARFNAEGSLDTTFGSGSKVTTDFSGYSDYAYALALQADGRIVVAGTSYTGVYHDFALARYLGDTEEAGPVLSVSPRALIFGKVEVGTTADKSFTVQNTGGGTLSGSATTAAPFSIVEGSPFSLGEGQSQEEVVRFSPSSKGFSLGSVSVDSNGGSATVRLVGKGK